MFASSPGAVSLQFPQWIRHSRSSLTTVRFWGHPGLCETLFKTQKETKEIIYKAYNTTTRNKNQTSKIHKHQSWKGGSSCSLVGEMARRWGRRSFLERIKTKPGVLAYIPVYSRRVQKAEAGGQWGGLIQATSKILVQSQPNNQPHKQANRVVLSYWVCSHLL